MRARRAEDRYAAANVREIVEALDELAHDAHHAPRIAAREVGRVASRLQQLFVFRDGKAANCLTALARGAARARRAPLGWWRASRGAVTHFRSFAEPLLRIRRRLGHHLGRRLLSPGRTRVFSRLSRRFRAIRGSSVAAGTFLGHSWILRG